MKISFIELKNFSPSGQVKLLKHKGKLIDSIFVSPDLVCSLYKFFEEYVIIYRNIRNNCAPQIELTSYQKSEFIFSKIGEFPSRPLHQ